MAHSREGRAEWRRKVAVRYLGSTCVVCGASSPLDFDHKDPSSKAFNIGDGIYHAGEVAFWVEVDKCQLLCHDHHAAKTRTEARARSLASITPPPGRSRKLSTAQVQQAAEEYKQGEGTYAAIAQRYGVSTSVLWAAVRRQLAEQSM